MAADSGECTVLVLLDLSAAFASVDHNILINRFTSYLSGRSFSLYANQVMSDTTELLCGVPQGSVLGQGFLYMKLTVAQFSNVSYHLYTDDIQLYCSFKMSEFDKLTSLLTCLNCIKERLNDNYLQLNSEKTEIVIIATEGSVPLIKQHIGAPGSSVKQNLRNLGV
uniref:Reverse transcriptase domain-containing protein n=1 Tax=Sparus aurata TaxID=8175 RepID=A0A671TKJ2_SPAAU